MQKVESLVGRVKDLLRWIDDRFNATVLASVKFDMPPTFSYVFSNLGMATILCFAIACMTGLPLLLYYKPSPWDMAYDSIRFLTENVAFGHLLRGIHYHASNGMVLFSIIHAIYVFFKRLYKGRFDFLWITGVLLGVVTIILAFTGYTLIFNDRAVEAQNIMLGMAETVHPIMKSLLAGTGLNDRALRLYGFHIGIIPAIMLVLIGLHLPRSLRISAPMAIGVVGVLFVATGIFPAELGPKFDPQVTPEFMPPEWYFLWVFALLRTWAPVLWVGIALPGALVVIMMAIPWLDRGRRPKLTDRPEFAVIGVTSIVYWIYLTFRALIGVGPPAQQILPAEVVGVFLLILGASTFVLRLLTPWLKNKPRAKKKPSTGYLQGNLPLVILALVILAQAALLWAFSSAFIQGNTEIAALSMGFVIIGLGVAQHVYAASYPK
ncbi:cytochrome bc complex cytochrome b subunit [Candidatus Bathyarchaeota archaeon]|nr:cytochrome bc complex cytochrome b subunit [Candidatus Bathyarchaeota archaeon]MBL7078923.1 cytochrome bc complex cytochrome b subunit [Candidatus Bathyarchaeota archaeon]